MNTNKVQVVLINLVAILGYMGFGMVSSGLTRSPEYFTPVWIPAGVVTLCALLWGRKSYLGLVLGSVGFHFYFYHGSVVEDFSLKWIWYNFNYVPIVIIQCEVARLLLLGFSNSPSFSPTLKTLVGLVARCALLAMVLPIVTNVFFLFDATHFTLSEWIASVGRWWFGDFLGIICLIPVPLLILQRNPSESSFKKLNYLSVVFIYLIGLVVGYRLIADHEVQSVEGRFYSEVDDFKYHFLEGVDSLIGEVDLLRLRFQKDRLMEIETFEAQARQILKNHAFVHSIAWVPFVGKEFGPLEHANQKFRIVSCVSNENSTDDVVSKTPFPDETTLRQAIESGSPQIKAWQMHRSEHSGQIEMQVYYAIEPADFNSLDELYQAGHYGLFQITFRMDDFLGVFWNSRSNRGMRIQVADVSDSEHPFILSEYEGEQVALDNDLLKRNPAIFEQTHALSIFDRKWELHMEGTRQYLELYHSSAPFFLLVGGLFVSFLLGIHTLSNYLRTRLIHAMVDDKTSELQTAKTEAERLAHAKSEFLAVMSHEIRTPMNGMISTTEMLRQTELNRDQEELAGIIEMSSQTLLALINDILDFSKLEAGKTQLEEEPFNPIEIAKTVEATFRAKSKEKGIGFQLSLPELSEPSLLIGDRSRLLQVLMNLVSNAVKFTNQGDVKLVVHVDKDTDHRARLVYEVIDSGIGISEEKQAELFEPFSQADVSSTREYGGTGLGLAIVKRIVELFGGKIDLKSTAGVGSTFTVSFNFECADLKEIPKESVEMNGFTLSGPNKRAKVLLVEDNLQNQKIMKLLLKRWDLEVDVADDGVIAVDCFEKNQYDLVFMDCRLPNMDGFEASRRIRLGEPNGQRIPIVALTASSYEGAREECFDSGMDDYITKPVTLKSVSGVMKQWLS